MNEKICRISLFSVILACVSIMPGESAIKTKNQQRSYSGAYQQINAMRYEQEYANATAQLATTTSATDNLPVTVDDEKLANSIINNDATAPSVSKLESCAMIYPDGVFKWGIPESGIRQNQTPQCVAVVELRNANTNEILATTTLAAGDSMKCNVDSFPEYGMSTSLINGKVTVPADVAPTMADVESVMNAEQRQNAGLKIAAGAILAGVAGNLLTPTETGKEIGNTPFGTGSTQLKNTALAASAGAAVMAASAYSGKVAGDTIKSTAVNAASGMVMGNMLAGTGGGDNVLATSKCTIDGTEHDCIAGKLNTQGTPIPTKEDPETPPTTIYIINLSGDAKKCTVKSGDKTKYTSCTHENLMNIQLVGGQSFNDFKAGCNRDNNGGKCPTNDKVVYQIDNSNDFMKITNVENPKNSNTYYQIQSANKVDKSQYAYAVFPGGTLKKMSGYKISDWQDSLEGMKPLYYRRYTDGGVGDKLEDKKSSTNGNNTSTGTATEFVPITRDASDGGLVDFSNEARLKGTVTGGAVGGALGGVAAYSGAKDEVTQRWLAATREYEDSLSNFVCISGRRYLAPYNSYVEIPALKEEQ